MLLMGVPNRDKVVAGIVKKNHHSVLCYCTSFLFYGQCFETGDDIEEFLVDTILAQTMKCPVKIL
jgi:hypothetical protein